MRAFLSILCLTACLLLTGQKDSFQVRNWEVHILPVSGLLVSQIVLSDAWYSQYPKQEFHFFNDLPEWRGMDKVGHVWSAYHLEHILYYYFQRHSKSDHKRAELLSLIYTQGFLLGIEILDGFSSKWGFSGYDVLANLSGSIISKLDRYSYIDFDFYLGIRKQEVFDQNLLNRSNNLFGTTLAEQLLKNYNKQTYWLAYYPNKQQFQYIKFGLGFGYGVSNIFGGRENMWNTNGVDYNYTSLKRKSEYYFGPVYKFSIPGFKGIQMMFKLPGPVLYFGGGSFGLGIR